MTVSVTSTVNSSTGNGVTTVFPYSFRILASGDIEVSVDGVIKTPGVDYTLTGVGSGSGGNVTFNVAPANATKVVRRRKMALVRTTDYQDNGDLLADVLNLDHDAPVLMVQQVQEEVDRSIKAPVGEVLDATLPAATARAGKFMGFDSNGAPVVLSGTGADAGLRSDLAASGGSALVAHGSQTVAQKFAAIDQSLATAPSIAASPFLRGINAISSSAEGMSSAGFFSNMELAQRVGLERISLVAQWYQATLVSNTMAAQPTSPSDASIRAAAAHAKSLGMRVTIKPHLNVLTGEFRGNINAADPTTWWTNYTAFILQYAALAEEVGAELFVIGTELETMNASGFASNWRALAASVRAVFSGSITYASNRLGEAVNSTWWDAVDYIGIDLYDALTAPGTPNPGVDALIAAFYSQNIVSNIDRISRKWSMPVLLTEIGYYSRTDTAGDPGTISAGATSEQAQADIFEATFRVIGEMACVKGMFIWVMSPSTGGAVGGYEWLPGQTITQGIFKRFWRNGPVGQKPTVSIPAAAGVVAQADVGVTDNTSLVVGLNAPLATVWGTVSGDAQFNTDKMWDPAVFVSRLTINTPGLYDIRATATFASNATGLRRVRILLNGDTSTGKTIASDTRNAANGQSTRLGCGRLYWLKKGDFVVMEVFQNSGGLLNLVGKATDDNTAFTAARIG